MASPSFHLNFRISEIDQWAGRYPSGWDNKALAAGKRIREGDYSRSNLEKIVEWKSGRRLALISGNSDSEIADALHLAAVHAKEPRSAFAVLMGLRGLAVPMASAVLTAIDQEKYTLVDWRAVEALGVPDADYGNLNFYLVHYFNVSLRTLDRALWAWSKGHKKK